MPGYSGWVDELVSGSPVLVLPNVLFVAHWLFFGLHLHELDPIELASRFVADQSLQHQQYLLSSKVHRKTVTVSRQMKNEHTFVNQMSMNQGQRKLPHDRLICGNDFAGLLKMGLLKFDS